MYEIMKKMLEPIIGAGRLVANGTAKVLQYYITNVTDQEITEWMQYDNFEYTRAVDGKQFFVTVQRLGTPRIGKDDSGKRTDFGPAPNHSINFTESTRIPVDGIAEVM